MFTKNWYKNLARYMRCTSGDGIMYKNTSNIDTNLNVVGGASLQPGNKEDSYICPSMYHLRTSLSDKSGVILGTGTTPPTIEDYYLSGDLITGYAYSVAVSSTHNNSRVTITALYTITNSGSTEFTIGEIGLITNLFQYNTSGAGYKCLLERTVLESPVTIPAGGVGQITYTITIEYPA